jgi:3',5'-cyclic AMP phosphodiesterase CpdA
MSVRNRELVRDRLGPRPSGQSGPPPSRRRRRLVGWTTLAVVFAALAVGAMYGRQITSLLTHRIGAPTRTFPIEPFDRAPDFRLAVAGDVGEGEEEEWRTANAMDALAQGDPYDALLLLGDNVYPDGDPGRLNATVFQPFGMLFRDGTRLLAILGNHDVAGGRGLEHIRRLGMPDRWWTVALGDVRIVGLDSNLVGSEAQLRFLEETLSTAEEPWKIVAIHESPYSSGYQGSNLDVRRRFVPLFERYGVQLVLSGHDHDYQRSRTIDGVTYVVTGAGGRTRGAGEEAFTAAAWSVLSFVDIAVYADRLDVRAVTQDVRWFDRVTIARGPVDESPTLGGSGVTVPSLHPR